MPLELLRRVVTPMGAAELTASVEAAVERRTAMSLRERRQADQADLMALFREGIRTPHTKRVRHSTCRTRDKCVAAGSRTACIVEPRLERSHDTPGTRSSTQGYRRALTFLIPKAELRGSSLIDPHSIGVTDNTTLLICRFARTSM